NDQIAVGLVGHRDHDDGCLLPRGGPTTPATVVAVADSAPAEIHNGGLADETRVASLVRPWSIRRLPQQGRRTQSGCSCQDGLGSVGRWATAGKIRTCAETKLFLSRWGT